MSGQSFQGGIKNTITNNNRNKTPPYVQKYYCTQGPFEFHKIIKMVHSDVKPNFLNSIDFSVNNIVATSILIYSITSVISGLPCLLRVISDITGATVTTTEEK